MSCPAHAGHPVRRGFSFIADFPAYWITRFPRVITSASNARAVEAQIRVHLDEWRLALG
jgi:hypothetical protein